MGVFFRLVLFVVVLGVGLGWRLCGWLLELVVVLC